MTSSEYTPNIMQIEGGWDISPNHVSIIGAFNSPSEFSKSASTVEQNLRDMFGYVSVIKKQPKVRIRRKKKPKKIHQTKHELRPRRKILAEDAEAKLSDDYEIAKKLSKKKKVRRKRAGSGSDNDDDLNIIEDLTEASNEIDTDLTQFIID